MSSSAWVRECALDIVKGYHEFRWKEEGRKKQEVGRVPRRGSEMWESCDEDWNLGVEEETSIDCYNLRVVLVV